VKRDFSALQYRPFDLLVCGGGIYGAWTAYDAALRGLSVAIVEQGDWANATSSASSKLIHGGLRYLETYDFNLVSKALAERRMLLENAPHRVWPLRFGVPLYAHSRIGALRLKAGLMLYDYLAADPSPEMKHRRFGRAAFSERFPALAPAALQSGFTYADAQTDDARLVLELIDGAIAAGAVCVNYCKLNGLSEEHGLACGATVQDMLGGATVHVSARQIVDATGQWASTAAPANSRLTKGVHLVLPAALGDEALLLTAPSDGRVFFMIPWYGLTLVGTTDTDYRGAPGRATVEAEDISYLLAAANHYLKKNWTKQDIIGQFAGLRVMKRSDQSAPSSVSRDWEIKTAANGVHYSTGGKITSAREDAASIVDTVSAQLGIDAACATRGRRFPWTPQENYSTWLLAATARAEQLGIDQQSAQWLIRRHGKRVHDIFRMIKNEPHLAGRILPALPFIHADLLWSAGHEMAVHLDDLLRRRMPLLILSRPDENLLRLIAATVAAPMGWDAAAVEHEIEHCIGLWQAQ